MLKVGLNPGALQGGSGEQYFVGTFDGSKFTNDNPASTTLWVDSGKDCYCALVFNGSISNKRPPVMLGWMSNWQYAGKLPTAPWRGQMTMPRQLGLASGPEGLRMVQQPISGIRGGHVKWQGQDMKQLNRILSRHGMTSFELQTTWTPGEAQESGWKVFAGADGTYTSVGYNKATGELFVDRTHSGAIGFSADFPARTAVKLAGESLTLRILVDRSSVEVFTADGRVAITNLVFPATGAKGIEFFSQGGVPKRMTMDLWQLQSTW